MSAFGPYGGFFGRPSETGNLGNHPAETSILFNRINTLYLFIKGNFRVTSR